MNKAEVIKFPGKFNKRKNSGDREKNGAENAPAENLHKEIWGTENIGDITIEQLHDLDWIYGIRKKIDAYLLDTKTIKELSARWEIVWKEIVTITLQYEGALSLLLSKMYFSKIIEEKFKIDK